MIGELTHAAHIGFFVVGQGDMNGRAEPRFNDAGNGLDHARNETLHVGGSARIETALALGERKRIGGPGLPCHGHDIRMPGQHQSAAVSGSDGGEQIGFARLRSVLNRGLDAVVGEAVRDPVNQRDVAVGADCVERNQGP